MQISNLLDFYVKYQGAINIITLNSFYKQCWLHFGRSSSKNIFLLFYFIEKHYLNIKLELIFYTDKNINIYYLDIGYFAKIHI